MVKKFKFAMHCEVCRRILKRTKKLCMNCRLDKMRQTPEFKQRKRNYDRKIKNIPKSKWGKP